MSLPVSGPISFSQVRSELGLTDALNMNNNKVRGLASKATGSIRMSDLYAEPARLYGVAGYVFTPTHTTSKLVTGLYAGYGIPSGWTAGVYGNCIEPYSGIYGAYNLWLGTPITPTGSSITITECVDNTGSLYIDQTRIATMSIGAWGVHTIATVPGQTIYVSVNIVGSSKYNGTVIRILNADGSVCRKTDTSWVST